MNNLEFTIENTSIIDETLNEKIINAVKTTNFEKDKEYELKFYFDEDIISTEKFFYYFMNKVPRSKVMEVDNSYKKIRSAHDYKIYIGDVLSYILHNTISAISQYVRIGESWICGKKDLSNDIEIIIEEIPIDKKSRFKVSNIVASETGAIENLIELAEMMNRREEIKKREEMEAKLRESKQKEETKPVSSKNKKDITIKMSVDDIAAQLGVPKEKLQELINNEKNK